MNPLDEEKLGRILGEFHPAGKLAAWRDQPTALSPLAVVRRRLGVAFAPLGIAAVSMAAVGVVAVGAGLHSGPPSLHSNGPAAARAATSLSSPGPTPSNPAPSTPSPTPICPPASTGNLLPDPSFESPGLGGWGSWQGNFARIQLGQGISPNGSWVAKVSYTSNWQYSLELDPVSLCPTAGDQFQLSAYVEAATPSAVTKPFELTFRERTPSGAAVLETTTEATLASSFQQVTVTGIIQHSGDVIDVYILQKPGAAGDAFYADQITLTKS